MEAKIVLVGPSKSGKSYMADFLSDDVTSGEEREYIPTRGCRIVSFETNGNKKTDALNVELWDISGLDSYENVWPALADGASGAIVMYDGTKPIDSTELSKWFKPFIKGAGIKTGQCVVFANNPSSDIRDIDFTDLDGPLGKASLFETDITTDPEGVRDAFNALLKGVKQAIVTKRDNEEDNMLNNM
eukprot:m.82298 g.82298  ORF g.82298 m.82298 type:complete len:187 (-) comp8665_c4_seq1:2602-3162(-)